MAKNDTADRKLKVFTYDNPYEIDKTLFWQVISNAPHFCVSQTMVNGLQTNFSYFKEGQLATVDQLVGRLFGDWVDNTERYIEQYSLVDQVIKYKGQFEPSTRDALGQNKKEILDSIRLIKELGIKVETSQVLRAKLSFEQAQLFSIIDLIDKNPEGACFDFPGEFHESLVHEAIDGALLDQNKSQKHPNLMSDTVIFHGIHQFTPLMLRSIEQVLNWKNVILLFNYQPQYKGIYKTWVDVYESFEVPFTSSNTKEFRPSFLMPSYEGNQIADNLGKLSEASGVSGKVTPFQILEFDNATQFANYVASIYDQAKELRETSVEEERHASVLYYMREQFYSAGGKVNEILKMYYPEQFGERHFLSYPVGRFFMAISELWDNEKQTVVVKDFHLITACLNSGIVKEEQPGTLSTTFNEVLLCLKEDEEISQMIKRLKDLMKYLRRLQSQVSDEAIDYKRVKCFNAQPEYVDLLIKALEEINTIGNMLYDNVEGDQLNFREFYLKARELIENRITHLDSLDDEFEEILRRLLLRLEFVDDINVQGTFECMRDTMSFYLMQQHKSKDFAKWVVRDFEQIDGDILNSAKQNEETVYHFCCLSDSHMNAERAEAFPWPLDYGFFQNALEWDDWKIKGYVTATKEHKNFKKYALLYGLQYNRVKFRLSYIKNEDDRVNQPYYLLRALGGSVKPYSSMYSDASNLVVSVSHENGVIPKLRRIDYNKFLVCKYKFLLESIVEKHTIYKNSFLASKYFEILLEMKVITEMRGKRFIERELYSILASAWSVFGTRFKFVSDIEKEDIIANAARFIKKEGIENGKYRVYEQDYLLKKKEFLILKLNSPQNEEINIYKNKLLVQNDSFMQQDFSLAKISSIKFDPSVELWCKYCSNSGICLESFLYENKMED